MVALVIVDGTGPMLTNNPAEYDKFYHNSFCSRLSRLYSPSSYTRGPVIQGTDTKQKGDRALRVALQMSNDPGCTGLVLVGHSRGGAAVIYAAQQLKKQGVEVDYMALFDAVDMETGVNGYYIPTNVLQVRHAMRSPSGGSRPNWGNCGVLYDGPGAYDHMAFYGTHAAVGGVPWKTAGSDGFIYESGELYSTRITVSQDFMASASVEKFMFPAIEAKMTELSRKQPKSQSAGGASTNPPASGGGTGAVPGNGGGGNGSGAGQKYTVVSGDSLSLIAGRYWKDVLLWPVIYDANKQVVGPDPNKIQVGQRLAIPSIAGYSESQLTSIRQRGRNC